MFFVQSLVIALVVALFSPLKQVNASTFDRDQRIRQEIEKQFFKELKRFQKRIDRVTKDRDYLRELPDEWLGIRIRQGATIDETEHMLTQTLQRVSVPIVSQNEINAAVAILVPDFARRLQEGPLTEKDMKWAEREYHLELDRIELRKLLEPEFEVELYEALQAQIDLAGGPRSFYREMKKHKSAVNWCLWQQWGYRISNVFAAGLAGGTFHLMVNQLGSGFGGIALGILVGAGIGELAAKANSKWIKPKFRCEFEVVADQRKMDRVRNVPISSTQNSN